MKPGDRHVTWLGQPVYGEATTSASTTLEPYNSEVIVKNVPHPIFLADLFSLPSAAVYQPIETTTGNERAQNTARRISFSSYLNYFSCGYPFFCPFCELCKVRSRGSEWWQRRTHTAVPPVSAHPHRGRTKAAGSPSATGSSLLLHIVRAHLFRVKYPSIETTNIYGLQSLNIWLFL